MQTIFAEGDTLGIFVGFVPPVTSKVDPVLEWGDR